MPLLGRRTQVVREQSAKLRCSGSNPLGASNLSLPPSAHRTAFFIHTAMEYTLQEFFELPPILFSLIR